MSHFSHRVGWNRRHFLAGAAGGVLSLALRPRIAQAASPRILVVGDSMIAGAFGLFLGRAMEKEFGLQVRRRGKSSSGLARPDFFNWFKEGRRLVGEFDHDAAVVMFGGNDVQGLYMGKGKWIRWHEDGWVEEYARRVAKFCDLIAPDGQRIFWVGLPVMRPNKFRARVRRVNAIYASQMGLRTEATFVDTWTVLASPEGEYVDKLKLPSQSGKSRRVRVRAGDGIHLSPAGAHLLKAHALDVIVPELARA